MTENSQAPYLRRFQRRHPAGYLLLAMAFYVSVVYGGSFSIHPLGRDYAALAGKHEGISGFIFGLMTNIFGGWIPGYHLMNLVLLYGCMLALHYFAWRTIGGPPWLGVLAAALFMSNPVHSEAMLNLSGVTDLLPGFLAITSFAAYAHLLRREEGLPSQSPGVSLFPAFVALLIGLALLERRNVSLPVVLFLYELLISKASHHRRRRLMMLSAALLVALIARVDMLTFARLGISEMAAPLYLIFYPIGFLPETAARFHEQPWLGWLSGFVVIALLLLMYRKMGKSSFAVQRAFMFGILGMVAIRLFQGGSPIDPVHMVGGGALLVPNALFTIALVSLFYRMMEHIKWRKPIVLLTSLLCLFFFGLEIRSVLAWREAGAVVQAFQSEAKSWVDEHPGKTLGILPDYRYYRGAPVCLAESVQYDTLFSHAVPAESVLPLHYERPERMTITLEKWAPAEGCLKIEGIRSIDVFPWPYRPASPLTHCRVEWTEKAPGQLEICLHAEEGELPGALLPLNRGD